jgi:hypothetical protein
MAQKVFINYRRDDTAPAAGRLYDRFCLLLGKRNVFFDVDTIGPGEHFEAKIQSEIGKSDTVLVLIGRKWLEPAQEGKQPRLHDDGDLVRAEIRAGLQRNSRIMPLLVDGAQMPKPELLPADIRQIALRNALSLRHESFDSDVDHIARTVLGMAPGALLWDQKGSIGRTIKSAVFGALLAAIFLFVVALAHSYLLKRPISASIGEAQTTFFIAAILILGVLFGLLRGSRGQRAG